jgi:parallel beta-helix repeat protein
VPCDHSCCLPPESMSLKKTVLILLIILGLDSALLSATLVWPGTAAEAAANVYYVATNGLDSYPGTIDRPWRTIQKAANTVVAGDTVYIRGGTYHERVSFSRSGTASQYITFRNYPNETVIVDGSVDFSGTGRWEAYSGNIYRTKPDYQINWPAKMLYQDGLKLLNYNGTTPISNPSQMTEGTWYLDTNSHSAYAWAYGGGNPGSHDTRITKFPTESPSLDQGLFELGGEGLSYLRIQGLQMRYSNGCFIEGLSVDHINMLDLDLRHAYSSLIKIEHSVDCVIDHVTGEDSGFAYRRETSGAEAIRVYGGSGVRVSNSEVFHSYNMGVNLFGGHRNGLVENCVFHEGWGDYRWDPAIYLEGTSYSTVRNNFIYGTHYGISLGHEESRFPVHHNTVVNNICYDCTNGCLGLKAWSSSTPTTNNLIAHNTFINAGSSERVPVVWVNTESYDNVVKNNIIMVTSDAEDNELVRIEDRGKDNLYDYNDYYGQAGASFRVLGTVYGFAGYTAAMAPQEAQSISEDPVLRDLGSRDFHLESESPCIDAGVDLGVTDDFDGNPRPVGSGCDIGAYEYSGAVTLVASWRDGVAYLSWDKPPYADLAGYRIRYESETGGHADQGQSPINVADQNRLTFELTGLTMYSLYEVWIEPYDGSGASLGESNRVPILPTDIFAHLPLVTRCSGSVGAILVAWVAWQFGLARTLDIQ